MRPYPRASLAGPEGDNKRVFNYRLNRARRCVENAFGIMAQRWRVYHGTVGCAPERVASMVKATCAQLRAPAGDRYRRCGVSPCTSAGRGRSRRCARPAQPLQSRYQHPQDDKSCVLLEEVHSHQQLWNSIGTRQDQHLRKPARRTAAGQRPFANRASSLLNAIPEDMGSLELSTLKRAVRRFYIGTT